MKKNTVRDDWRKATSICRQFVNLECLKAVEQLVDHFGRKLTVAYVCTLKKGLTPHIVHPCTGDSITRTGNHFAVALHGRMFDNLHPGGITFRRWLANFEYITKDLVDATFEVEDVIWIDADWFIRRRSNQRSTPWPKKSTVAPPRSLIC